MVRKSHISGNVLGVSANVTGRKKRKHFKLERSGSNNASGNIANLNSDLSDDQEAFIKRSILGHHHNKSKSLFKSSIDSSNTSEVNPGAKRS